MTAKQAILVLAYGSPTKPEEVEPYLLDVRGGRPTPPELVEEIRARYVAVGGESPLSAITAAQAEGVAAVLAARGLDVASYVGMRHWTPWIADTLAAMQADGVTSAVAIVMAPHYSKLSVGRYREKVESSLASLGYELRLNFVESWWQQPELIAAQAAALRQALAGELPEGARRKVLFTAHSLPARVKAMGDNYDAELLANAEAVAAAVGGLDWEFVFQSAGATKEPWLGPAIEDRLPELAAEGYTHVLAQPLGFVCDHIEILFDLDIESAEIAREQGLVFSRTESMNTGAGFLAAVADAVEPALREFAR